MLMCDLLLVGRNEILLRMLYGVFRSRSLDVEIASTPDEIVNALSHDSPRVVLYQHCYKELFDLNPRNFGFRGGMMVLSDDIAARVKRSMAGEQVMLMP